MKKLIAVALLAVSSASFAVDEHLVVKGKDLSGSSAGGSIGGNPVGGSSGGLGGRGGSGGTGGTAGAGKLGTGELSNAQVLVMVMEQWGAMVDMAASKEIWGELDVIVTTKDGTKVEVHLKVGFGKREIVSATKK